MHTDTMLMTIRIKSKKQVQEKKIREEILSDINIHYLLFIPELIHTALPVYIKKSLNLLRLAAQ